MSGGEGEARVKGGVVHRIFQISFIVFNLAMAVWLVSYIASSGPMQAAAMAAAKTAEERQAAEYVAAGGGGVLLFFWLFGAVLLGLMASLTKARRKR